MKIAIVGYGVEGRAVEHYFSHKGVHVAVRDSKNGPGYLQNLDEFDLVFRSPGVPYLKKEFNAIRSKLTSQTKYFFEKCPCPIVGVTGTKGKGTTSTLIYEMLNQTPAIRQKGRVFIGGNIGTAPLTFLDELTDNDLVVLELSSFQLHDLDRSPHVAVVLGITPDHLDHHKDMQEYVEAKKNSVKFQSAKDFAAVDMDNKLSATFARATKARVFGFSTEQQLESGSFIKVGSLVFRKDKTGTIFGEAGEVGLVGPHNIKNILAAATAASLCGVPVEVITKVVREFRGLPHRLELIAELGGVRFFDDSASTNPDTAIAALRSFSNPVILIAGGSSKNISFEPLGEEIAKRLNIKTVILMGETQKNIEKSIEDAVVKIEVKNRERVGKARGGVRRRDIPLELISAETYQEAFMVARLVAQPGDTVLLSPACASFDMFANYKERGDVFKKFVLDS